MTKNTMLKKHKKHLQAYPWLVMSIDDFARKDVEATRKPTQWDIRLGYGATHYKIMPYHVFVCGKTGRYKNRAKCPQDNLFYSIK